MKFFLLGFLLISLNALACNQKEAFDNAKAKMNTFVKEQGATSFFSGSSYWTEGDDSYKYPLFLKSKQLGHLTAIVEVDMLTCEADMGFYGSMYESKVQ